MVKHGEVCGLTLQKPSSVHTPFVYKWCMHETLCPAGPERSWYVASSKPTEMGRQRWDRRKVPHQLCHPLGFIQRVKFRQSPQPSIRPSPPSIPSDHLAARGRLACEHRSLNAQGACGVDGGCAPCGNDACNRSRKHQHSNGDRHDGRVHAGDLIKL
jgi:hypothetical protein